MNIEDRISKAIERLATNEMPAYADWPETCEGCLQPVVIFLGPSPGGKKEVVRRSIEFNGRPLWNESYNEPLNWSRGFKKSYRPLVEGILNLSFDEASKLVARMNMDWQGNPESKDVSPVYMWIGCQFLLPLIEKYPPSLIVPMDEKTFSLFQVALYNSGWKISDSPEQYIKIKISNSDNPRFHNHVMAFLAEKNSNKIAVVKSLQHPARIYDEAYATRVGETIREVADCIFSNRTIRVEKN